MKGIPIARPAPWIVGVLLIVLGLLAVVGPVTGRLRDEYRARAESFAHGEAALLDQIAETLAAARLAETESGDGPRRAEVLRSEAERLARVGAWHVRLERKYAWAADHPWAPLPPDPKPPE